MSLTSGDYDFSYIEDVWIPLRAELGNKKVLFSDLLKLDVGSILQLGRATGDNVDLLAGDVRLGSAEILVVDSVLALRFADFSEGDAGGEPPVVRSS